MTDRSKRSALDPIWRRLCTHPASGSLRRELALQLKGRGDPWGELIEAQLALASLPRWDDRRSALRLREAELLGPWIDPPHAWRKRWRHYPDVWRYAADCPFWHGGTNPFALTKHDSLLRGLPARISQTAPWLLENAGALEELPVEELRTSLLCVGKPRNRRESCMMDLHLRSGRQPLKAREFAKIPVLKSLRRLRFDLQTFGRVQPPLYTALASPLLAGLRELCLGADGNNLLKRLPGTVLARIPFRQLERLEFDGYDYGYSEGMRAGASRRLLLDLPACDFPSIRALRLHGLGVDGPSLRPLLQAPWLEQLEELDLRENPVGDEGLIALAGCRALTRCKRLDIAFEEAEGVSATRSRAGRRGVEALLGSPHLQGLEVLSLHGLRAEGIQALVEASPLPRLLELNLSLAWDDRSPPDDGEWAAGLVRSPWFPQLRQLGISGVGRGEPVLQALVEQAEVSELRALYLRGAASSNEALTRLVESPCLRSAQDLGLHLSDGSTAVPRALASSKQLRSLSRLWLWSRRFEDAQLVDQIRALTSGDGLDSLVFLDVPHEAPETAVEILGERFGPRLTCVPST